MLPMIQPKVSVIASVKMNAVNGVASPSPKGKPHLSMSAMDIPANPIIDPIDRSNSPAIINSDAPIAMIPYCAMILMLFLRPSALKAFISEAKPSATMITIITIKAPISGRLTNL